MNALKPFFDLIGNALTNIGKQISKVTNPVILSIMYLAVIGLTWLYTKLCGIKALEITSSSSTWTKVDAPNPREKDCLHQW